VSESKKFYRLFLDNPVKGHCNTEFILFKFAVVLTSSSVHFHLMAQSSAFTPAAWGNAVADRRAAWSSFGFSSHHLSPLPPTSQREAWSP